AEATAKAWEEYNAQILLDARKNARLTQAELAERIGADKSYISRIERGITVPAGDIINAKSGVCRIAADS
ncbi:MAG: helix-turn-helix transcriptional regulator, partial [Bacteroidaceae bacterium]|nr:helix-turn-helix transcriptional regulator [Bacteroidaceae bacterium]